MLNKFQDKNDEVSIELVQPHPLQLEILQDPTRFKVVNASRRFGKQLWLETPVFTFNDGWKTVGTLNVGDFVVGSNGNPTKVIYLAPINEIDGFEFTFSTGEKVKACKYHDWVTYDNNDRRNINKKINSLVIPTKRTSEEIVDTFKSGHKKKQNNHSIQLIKPIVFENSLSVDDFEIHPYVLGCWLADGKSKSGSVCGVDREIHDRIKSLYRAKDWRKYIQREQGKRDYTITSSLSLKKSLKKLGVLNNKHIPKQYLYADEYARRELLRGFSDCDGSITKDGSVTIEMLEKTGMISDLAFLVRSLGVKCSITTKRTRSNLHGKLQRPSKMECIHFTPYLFNPFCLSRKWFKADKYLNKKSKKQLRHIYFTDYKPLDEKILMRCIGVDAPDHLFAVGETFVLTHNTQLGQIAIAEEVMKNAGEAFWISPTFSMSSQIWKELKNTFYHITESKSEQNRTIEVVNGGRIRVFSGETPDRMRGTSPNLVIIDEAAMITDASIWYGILRPSLADKRGRAYFLSTPRGRNWFYDLYLLGNNSEVPDYRSFTAPTWANPYIPKSEILEAKKTLPEKLFRQEFLAEFLLDAGAVFVGVTDVAIGLYLEPYVGNFSMGVDLGKQNDFTVLSIFDINRKAMVHMEKFNEISWSAQRKRIENTYRQWNPNICIVEENNIGSVIIEDLKKQGLRITPYYTTNKSKDELINRMAVAIQNKDIVLLNDRDLVLEFQSMEMNITSTGRAQYGAPSGMHDDIVMATCLAWNGVVKRTGVYGRPMPKLNGWD